ncbi:MAG: hypothetical protein QOH10_1134 [Actinomycetota bacterium]|jgi:hypothetical protein|nr:hypothetical protein [Actinomycetota bacterium]
MFGIAGTRGRALVAVGVSVAMAIGAVGVVGAEPAGAFSRDISFDGYCDGLHLSVPSVGTQEATSVDGYRTGCETGGVFGTAKPNASGDYGVLRGAEFLTIPNASVFTVVKKDHTWVHYGVSGNLIYVFASGTWSIGVPPARSTVSSYSDSAARAASASVQPARVEPFTTKNIKLDGYCDGLSLVSPSAGLPTTPHTVDGHRTGCASDQLMGAKTTIVVGQNKAYIVTFNDQATGDWIQAVIAPDHTWVMNSLAGNAIVRLNSGTWAVGNPPPGLASASVG